MRESGKTERVREKSGNFKILLTRPIIYAIFSQFLSASPPDPHRGSAPVNTAGYFILQYFTMEQSLVLYLCILSIVLLVSRIKKLVRENYSFCLEKSGKMNSAK